MDDLPVTDADLVLFKRRVVLSDQHGGGDTVTATFTVLRSRGEQRMAKRRRTHAEKRGKGEGGKEKMERSKEKRMRTRLRCAYVGWITVLLAAMLLQLTPT